jgi:hypothetical protein
VSNAYFSQKQLAARWGLSPRTFEGWRWRGTGPAFLKLGGRVVYKLEDILAYEAEHRHLNTVRPAGSTADGHRARHAG